MEIHSSVVWILLKVFFWFRRFSLTGGNRWCRSRILGKTGTRRMPFVSQLVTITGFTCKWTARLRRQGTYRNRENRSSKMGAADAAVYRRQRMRACEAWGVVVNVLSLTVQVANGRWQSVNFRSISPFLSWLLSIANGLHCNKTSWRTICTQQSVKGLKPQELRWRSRQLIESIRAHFQGFKW